MLFLAVLPRIGMLLPFRTGFGCGREERRLWPLGRAAPQRRGLRRGDFVRPCGTVGAGTGSDWCGSDWCYYAYHGGAGNDKNGAGLSARLPPAAAPGGAFPGGPAPAWALFPFLPLPHQTWAAFALLMQVLQQTWGGFAS